MGAWGIRERQSDYGLEPQKNFPHPLPSPRQLSPVSAPSLREDKPPRSHVRKQVDAWAGYQASAAGLSKGLSQRTEADKGYCSIFLRTGPGADLILIFRSCTNRRQHASWTENPKALKIFMRSF